MGIAAHLLPGCCGRHVLLSYDRFGVLAATLGFLSLSARHQTGGALIFLPVGLLSVGLLLWGTLPPTCRARGGACVNWIQTWS